MSLYAVVAFANGETKSGLKIRPQKFRLKLETRGTKVNGMRPWKVVGQVPDQFVKWAYGTEGLYQIDVAGFIQFFVSGEQVMELRATRGERAGLAFGALDRGGVRFRLQGQWQSTLPVADNGSPLNAGYWGGFMVKASGSAAGRAELGIGVVQQFNPPYEGVCFVSGSKGAGATLGASGGFAVVLCTGMQSWKDFDQYTSSSWDWDLSFGPKWSSMVKGATNLPKIVAGLKALEGFMEAADTTAKASRMAKYLRTGEEGAKELYSMSKSLMQVHWLDTESQNITALDIPGLGAGMQVGIHWAWSGTKVLSNW